MIRTPGIRHPAGVERLKCRRDGRAALPDGPPSRRAYAPPGRLTHPSGLRVRAVRVPDRAGPTGGGNGR